MKRMRPQRRRFLLGCEGESERSYGKLLFELVNERRQDIHIDPVILGRGGGDALTLVQRALEHIENETKKGRVGYEASWLLLDEDLRGQRPRRDATALRIAVEADIEFIWQQPCHEGLLLRHIPGCERLAPRTCASAMRQLIRHWPNYSKAFPERLLANRIDYADVVRAASVTPDLAKFLTAIGFL
jgi:hypothetical protein